MSEERAFFSGEALEPSILRQELFAEKPGVVMSLNAAPPGVLIVRNFLADQDCRKIIAATEGVHASKAKVLSETDDGKIDARETATRRTDQISPILIGLDARSIVKKACCNHVATHFYKRLSWFEDPVILRYLEGGEYTAHADAYNWNNTDKRWRRSADRDFSILIYLNEDFDGGNLEFKYYDFKIEPCAGLLVVFPSDWRYAHAATPVTRGIKYSIVSFAATHETPKLFQSPPNAIRL